MLTPTPRQPSRPVYTPPAAVLANNLADAAEVVLQAQRELAAGNPRRAALLRKIAAQMLESDE
jgi:hypothetical protein